MKDQQGRPGSAREESNLCPAYVDGILPVRLPGVACFSLCDRLGAARPSSAQRGAPPLGYGCVERTAIASRKYPLVWRGAVPSRGVLVLRPKGFLERIGELPAARADLPQGRQDFLAHQFEGPRRPVSFHQPKQTAPKAAPHENLRRNPSAGRRRCDAQHAAVAAVGDQVQEAVGTLSHVADALALVAEVALLVRHAAVARVRRTGSPAATSR